MPGSEIGGRRLCGQDLKEGRNEDKSEPTNGMSMATIDGFNLLAVFCMIMYRTLLYRIHHSLRARMD